jgi:hypothetical protein
MAAPNGIPGMDCFGNLAITCWCGEVVLWLPPEDVREGRTGVCGAASCAPPNTEAA